MKLMTDTIYGVIDSIPETLCAAKLPPGTITRFQALAREALFGYQKYFGEDVEFEYEFKKRFTGVEMKITVPGSPFDPILGDGEDALNQTRRLISGLLGGRITTSFTHYAGGKNIVTVRAPRHSHERTSPMLLAVVLGIVCGLLCRLLPQNVHGFVIDQLVSPISSILLSALSGVMGPVLFLSLLNSVTALNSISELNTLGRNVIRRFLLMTVWIALMSIGVCILFFHNMGDAAASFSPEQPIQLILNIIPTNLFTPFVENNFPQLIILGFGLGAALLVMGERGNRLKTFLSDTSLWLQSLMDFVARVTPCIPFLNLCKLAATGDLSTVFGAWKYIVAFFICMLVYAVWKLCFVSLRHSLSPILLLMKLKPLLVKSFVVGSRTTTLSLQQEIAEKQFGIRPSFSAFWIPMSYAMLNPTSTISYIVPAFFIAQFSGVPVSASFLLVLFLLSVQLSLASPGLISGWVIILGQLGLSTDYIGVLSACKTLTGRVAAIYGALCFSLEELDAAFSENAVDETILRSTDEING